MSAKKYNIAKREDAKKEETEDKLWISLKRHIMRERERKKQRELETAKEEQLRNEREARKKQDNIKTLGKTQEEIQQVEEQMIQLKNKKHQLFLQLKALITKEVEMEKLRKESEIVNVRNDVGLAYQPYSSNDKGGVKRPHSPVNQADYYKHGGQTQRYLPPKTDSGITGNRLWYNPAKYAQSQTHQGWPITNVPNRGYIQQAVPSHPILIPHNDPTPQLVKQQPSSQQSKTNSISIEKIPTPQQDFALHRRLLSSAVPPSTQAPAQTFFTASGQIVYPEYITQNRDFPNK
jgi:hypothetical protein